MVKTAGSDIFSQGTVLRIEIEGAEPLLLKPKQETVFGRRYPATGTMPDVDLTPFAGYRMGVSRKHALIRQDEVDRLDLWDLGSSNGTFLNGTRLNANRPYKIRDGDEIRFGQMVMHVYFQRPPDTGSLTKPL
jgi:pSer/pThr/pTyr-binding forkhead associated (FHA) protein